ncbi:MAG: acetyl-CoA hydrolase [Rhodospirillales bacterium]|nr:acetyl-CoA hydrolase [Rhodospirillales bacterium]
MPVSMRPAELGAKLRGAKLVYAPGAAGESPIWIDALRDAADSLDGVCFAGAWIPGVNVVDYAGLHPHARARAFFIDAARRESFAAGRTEFLPLPYTRIYPLLQSWQFDVALLHVSPPDATGRCSLGVAADFTAAAWAQARCRVAHVNPAMPVTRGAATIAWDDLDFVVEEERALLTYDAGGMTDEFDAIGRHVSRWIEDGDVLQLGIGKAPPAVLRALDGQRNLRLHGGMITDTVLEMGDVLAPVRDAVTTGVALGSAALYDRCARDEQIRFAATDFTHGLETLARLDGLVAINSTIEIDLMGQCNAESIGQRQVSGAGGLVDFLRGARAAKRGRGFVTLASTAQNGRVSRIVSRLESPVSVARGDVDLVATEHGVADLRGRDLDARAEALIGIAAPPFRGTLADEWAALRRRM